MLNCFRFSAPDVDPVQDLWRLGTREFFASNVLSLKTFDARNVCVPTIFNVIQGTFSNENYEKRVHSR